MSFTARVTSIEALSGWKGSLRRFVGETREVLQTTEQKIQRTQEWLRESVSHWRHEVEQYEEEVRTAKRELELCWEDEDSDCSAEEEALLDAKQRLRNGKEELRNVQNWKRRADEMAATYRVQAERLRHLMFIEMPRADAFLGRAIDNLHKYVTGVSIAEQAALTGSVSSPISEAISVKGYTTWRVEDKQLRSAWETLLATEKGKAIAETIRQRGAIVKFGYLPEDREGAPGELGHYYPEENEIVIRLDQKDKSRNVLAAHLAHEGTHVQWWFRNGKPNSEDQEYHAYEAQDKVWREVKGNESDENCEEVSKLISLGEDWAKDVIHLIRPGLPDTV